MDLIILFLLFIIDINVIIKVGSCTLAEYAHAAVSNRKDPVTDERRKIYPRRGKA